ncbi:MAG TPA: glutaredoxin family protein [Candidatus Krumholzibacteriaceae bacterium]|nr:glutaredoxin family protein [Candidatus Krumholzibacteriaceae bacterium]
MNSVKVDGKRNEPKLFLYTLSTCGWCKKTKEFLKDSGMVYEYVDVDKITKEEQKEVIAELKKRNAPLAFPVIIVDDEQVISGFKKQAIEEALAQ